MKQNVDLTVLQRTNLAFLITELDQVGVAASVTGSGKAKLRELAQMGTAVADALHGTRDEVERVRKDIRRRAHDVKVSQTVAKVSSKRIHALRDAIMQAERLVKLGLGNMPEMTRTPRGGFTFYNEWGYSPKELIKTMEVFELLEGRVWRANLWGARSDIHLRPAEKFCQVIGKDVVCDPDRLLDELKPLWLVARSLGVRIWQEKLSTKSQAVWEVAGGLHIFERAVAAYLSGDPLSRDGRARLRVTLGVP